MKRNYLKNFVNKNPVLETMRISIERKIKNDVFIGNTKSTLKADFPCVDFFLAKISSSSLAIPHQ
jgi:hypothetical protein